MTALNENALAIVQTTTGVDLNAVAATETTLYTVPTGKTFYPTHVIIRDPSADTTNAVVTFGVGGGSADEFRPDQTLGAVDGTTKYTVIYLDQGTNDTPEASVEVTAGNTFVVEITTAAGVTCTATMDAIGILA